MAWWLLPAILEGVSTVLNVRNQRQQAKLIRTQGGFARYQYERNAMLAAQQAQDAYRLGEVGVQQLQREGRQLIGAQRAGLAAQGLSLTDGGSGQDITRQTQQITDTDAATLRMNAARQAWGYTTEAETNRQLGQMAEQGAINQASVIRNQALPTILQGGMNVASIYRNRPQPVSFDTTPVVRRPSPTSRTRGLSGYGID